MFNPEQRIRLISAALALSLSITACFEGKRQNPQSPVEKTPVSTPTLEATYIEAPTQIPVVATPTSIPLVSEVNVEPPVKQMYTSEFLQLTLSEKTLLITSVAEVLAEMGKTPEEIESLLAISKRSLDASGLQAYLEKVGEKRKFQLDELFLEVRWPPVNRFLVNDGTTWTGESSQKGSPVVIIYDVGSGVSAYPVLTADQERVEYTSDDPDISVVVEQDMPNPFNLNEVRNNIDELDYKELLNYLNAVTKIQSLDFVMKTFEMRETTTYSHVLVNPFTNQILLIRTQ